jgi:hypothetical protein
MGALFVNRPASAAASVPASVPASRSDAKRRGAVCCAYLQNLLFGAYESVAAPPPVPHFFA